MFRAADEFSALDPAWQEAGVHMNMATSQAPVQAVVRATRPCTAGPKPASYVRHIELDVGESVLRNAFRAGQCAGVIAPGLDERGRPQQVRLFSLASPTIGEDGHGRVISLTVKRLLVEDLQTHRLHVGLTSNYLCDLQVGDTVSITGPVGKRLVAPENAEDFNFIFIATGTGIAPFRGLVMDLLSAHHARPIRLYAGAAYASDLLYHDAFTTMASKHTNFHYLPTTSRQPQLDRGPAMYVHQRMLQDRDEVLELLSSPRTLIYICGLVGMELGVLQALAHLTPDDALPWFIKLKSPHAIEHVDQWTRQTLRADVRPGPRVRVEVY